jgi:hypothetical protein
LPANNPEKRQQGHPQRPVLIAPHDLSIALEADFVDKKVGDGKALLHMLERLGIDDDGHGHIGGRSLIWRAKQKARTVAGSGFHAGKR